MGIMTSICHSVVFQSPPCKSAPLALGAIELFIPLSKSRQSKPTDPSVRLVTCQRSSPARQIFSCVADSLYVHRCKNFVCVACRSSLFLRDHPYSTSSLGVATQTVRKGHNRLQISTHSDGRREMVSKLEYFCGLHM